MVELDELLFRWQQGENISQLSRSLGQSRQTVRAYLKRAEHLGFTRDADDTRRAEVVRTMLRKAPAVTSPARDELVPWLEQIRQWYEEQDITAKQLWRLLRRQGLKASYQSVNRFIHENVTAPAPRTTVRLETPPGRQAQVDFGKVRVRVGDTLVWLWVFVMTLSYSRHRFVRFVSRQGLTSWLDCHVRAFEFFGGVPETILLDNLKAGWCGPICTTRPSTGPMQNWSATSVSLPIRPRYALPRQGEGVTLHAGGAAATGGRTAVCGSCRAERGGPVMVH